MKTPSRHSPVLKRSICLAVAVAFMVAIAALAVPLNSASSLTTAAKSNAAPEPARKSVASNWVLPSSALLPAGLTGETVTLYAADCQTPAISFNLGETICAKTDGVDLSIAGNYYLNLFHPDLTESNGGTITQNPQFFLFSLPTSNTQVGTWKANIGRVTPPETSIIGNPPTFSVSDGPSLATFASDCTTPKTSFVLGDTVCARSVGEPLGPPVQRRFSWINSAGFVASSVDITTDPQTSTFPLSTNSSARGAWFVNSTGNEGEAHLSVGFSVSDPDAATDPAKASTDLTVGMASAETVSPGSDLFFTVRIANRGPDSAANVQLTDVQPANTTFVSPVTQTAGTTTFSCTGTTTVTCTATSMPKGDEALLVIRYTVNSGTPDQTIISNTVNVTSTTTELKAADNTFEATSTVDTGTPPTSSCVLDCPDNITVTANTSEGSVAGAHVTFEAAVPIGDCGAITTSVPSGSFFPVGTTTVSVSSDTNGGSCSFNVIVTQAPLTITCPADQTVTAATGDTTANVNPGTPTTNPTTGVTVTGVRSDDDDDPATPPLSLTAPYPIGVTYITWTVRETSTGRTAVCTQVITVNTAGRPNLTITCPANQSVTAPSGQCEATVNPGTPTTNPSDSDVTVEGVRSDGAALSAPYPAGITAITWSATDAVTGQSASCTQTITVATDSSDTTPPTFTSVPPNVSVTTNSCGQIVGESQLGTPQATDTGNNCSPGTVTISRTGVPPGDFFPTGTTTITYTARDAAGNTATATQTVTVTEDPAIPPSITAPASVTVSTGAGATSCGTVVSDAALGSASASDNCPGVTVTRIGVPTGNLFPVGTTVVTYTATDRSGNTTSATQNVTVIDNTPPIITAPANVTAFTGAGATSCGTVVSDATLGAASASDNCPGLGAINRIGVPAGNNFPVGTTTLTYSVTDAHGNTSSTTQTVTVIDNTPPVVTCPANVTVYLPLNSTAVSMPVSYSPASATDNCDTSVTIGYSQASGSVFPVGTTTVTVTATDDFNNSSTCAFTVTVLYDFTGFFAPVDNLPTLNVVNAGRGVPVKFSLSGNKGLNIFAANSPSTVAINCDGSAPQSDVQETVTAGSSSLSYSSGSDQYVYTWKTESSWAGTCRQLTVKLNDGSEHKANFKFK